MRRTWLILVLYLCPGPVWAGDDLVADLSSASIAVTTGFTGTSLTVFGALDRPAGPSEDLIIAVEGPVVPLIVHRKKRQYGIWVNGDAVSFDGVHSFYAITSTPSFPLSKISSPVEMHALGFDALTTETQKEAEEYRKALIRLETDQGRFDVREGKIHLMEHRLFRADFNLPANVPIGSYQVHIAVVRDDTLIAERHLAMTIDDEGMAALLHHAAYESRLLYSICSLAVIFALGAAGTLFNRKGD